MIYYKERIEGRNMKITDTIKYVGVNDHQVDLFEGQYAVPNGMAYNSYVILDDKVAVMDTVDANFKHEWLDNLEQALGGRKPDYLIVQHMEPDHAANVANFLEVYPGTTVVANAKTFVMIKNFFGLDLEGQKLEVENGSTLSLGNHNLTFVFAPMVHWPEVMVTYEQSEKILFSADGFGTFGSLDANEEWIAEARKYYINIVGKYGNPVQALLKKASGLDIQMICPLHGPVLKENLGYYIEKYQIWSSYEPEDEGILIAYASIHGNTKQAAEKMRDILIEKGAKNVVIMDLSRDDMARAVENAFRYSKMVLACATYDGGIFPCMEDFLNHLKAKNYQKRTVAFMENGSWAPAAAKLMKGMLEKQKDLTIVEPVVTIRSTMKPETVGVMEELADALL
jgi:flavorubredoxin